MGFAELVATFFVHGSFEPIWHSDQAAKLAGAGRCMCILSYDVGKAAHLLNIVLTRDKVGDPVKVPTDEEGAVSLKVAQRWPLKARPQASSHHISHIQKTVATAG